MTNSITIEKFENLIQKNLDLNLKLKNQNYYQFKILDVNYVGTSKDFHLDKYLYPGILLIEWSLTYFHIFPSIQHYIINVSDLILNSRTQINKFTKGYPVDIEQIDNGIYKVKLQNSLILGLGKVSSGILSPICDIGFYLRFET